MLQKENFFFQIIVLFIIFLIFSFPIPLFLGIEPLHFLWKLRCHIFIFFVIDAFGRKEGKNSKKKKLNNFEMNLMQLGFYEID